MELARAGDAGAGPEGKSELDRPSGQGSRKGKGLRLVGTGRRHGRRHGSRVAHSVATLGPDGGAVGNRGSGVEPLRGVERTVLSVCGCWRCCSWTRAVPFWTRQHGRNGSSDDGTLVWGLFFFFFWSMGIFIGIL